MITRNTRRVLSSVVLAAYLMIYAAPIGLCIEPTRVKSAEVDKPVLRAVKPVPAVKKAPTVLKLEGDISISKGNPKISVSLRDSDVKQVLRMFADKAGLNIIFHSSVGSGVVPTGAPAGTVASASTVTLDLVNVPLNEAFKMVMQVSGLTYYIDNNTMVVADAAAASTLNLSKKELMSIPVKYSDASVMADFLNRNIFTTNKPGLSNANIVTTNPMTNEVLVFGTENDFRMAKKIVEKFDLKPTSTTFTVNHTTPREMATLICNVLFPPAPGATATTPTTVAAPPSGASAGLTLGAGVVACVNNNTQVAQATQGAQGARGANSSLASIGTKNLMVTYFPQHGTVSVSGGSEEQKEMVKEFIAKNDKKQPQAYLEISIIELNESGSQNFQNTWNLWSENFSASFNGGHVTTNPLYPTTFGGDTLDNATRIVRYADIPTLTYAIDYIIENKKGRILANPRIMITNGELSTIDLTSDYVRTVTSQVNNSGLVPIITRTYEVANDDGIRVDMTPFISPEGYVTLNIRPVYATVKEKVFSPSVTGTGQDLAATLLQRRNLDLKNVRIRDGETLVIGGMIREEEQKTIQKIPLLGDLPGVGFFFRNNDIVKSKQELIIMITPKIIKDSEEMVSNPDMTL